MKLDPQYQQALDYLYSFVDYSLTRSFRYSPEKFDLSRMRALMESLGHPEQGYSILHIAGTKGKGSVSALCSSALRAGGYRVGLYTSPHLHDYAERIQINAQPISHAEMASLVEEIKPHVAAIPGLTTFELTTALAFLYFTRQKVNAAVIEVGLGGRLDATNVVLPAVSVITSLSYDHTQILGSTLAEIAGEKAGIIKPGIPVVLAPQEEEARQVVEAIAAERSCRLIEIGRDFLFAPLEHSLDGQSLRVWPSSEIEGSAEQLTIPLLGYHQVQNAATAYAALLVFQERALPISIEAIRQGFSQVHWPGRFEVLRREPPVVVDSAHNRDSARKLRLALDDYFPDWPAVLLFGASEDKDISGMFAELLPRVSHVVATRSFHPRAIEPERLVELARPYSCPVAIVPEVADALEEALCLAGDDKLVLIAGSIFIAAGVQEAWQAREGVIKNEK